MKDFKSNSPFKTCICVVVAVSPFWHIELKTLSCVKGIMLNQPVPKKLLMESQKHDHAKMFHFDMQKMLEKA